MLRRIKLSTEVGDVIRALHPEIKRKVRSALDAILKDPALGKPLHDELAGYRSLRIGKIRIVYRDAKDLIEVAAVGPRKTIYFETALYLRRLKRPISG